MTALLIINIMAIILQYTNTLNKHVRHIKLRHCYILNLFQLRKISLASEEFIGAPFYSMKFEETINAVRCSNLNSH